MIFRHKKVAILLVLFALVQISFQCKPPSLPKAVIRIMGSRHMRYHHFAFHNLRELWPLIDEKTQAAIADLGWAVPRPSMIYAPDGTSIADEENFSGEDFLWMHHQMILETNKILAILKTPYKKIVGWKRVPKPNDKYWPVPPKYVIPSGLPEDEEFSEYVSSTKTDEFYRDEMVPAEKALRDPKNLRQMNLGQFGSRVEFTVHKWMHLRFSELTYLGVRPITNNPVPDIDKYWDNLDYQYLSDTYGSHVNPIFWKIHGWVEDRLEDWRKANNLKSIPWKHTWEGGPMAKVRDLIEVSSKSDLAQKDKKARLLRGDTSHNGHEAMHQMEEVVRLLLEATGKESPLAKKVIVSQPWKV